MPMHSTKSLGGPSPEQRKYAFHLRTVFSYVITFLLRTEVYMDVGLVYSVFSVATRSIRIIQNIRPTTVRGRSIDFFLLRRNNLTEFMLCNVAV